MTYLSYFVIHIVIMQTPYGKSQTAVDYLKRKIKSPMAMEHSAAQFLLVVASFSGIAYNSNSGIQKAPNGKDSIGAYAVQCFRCFKWRLIPTKEEFEAIRERFTEDPWHCEKMPNNSCDEPADIEYDTTRIWVIDRPNIPKAPPNTERLVMMRHNLSKMDIYYVMPNGKKVRGTSDVAKFLHSHPQYKKRMSISKFCFVSPKVAEETVAQDSEWRNKKQKKENSG